MFVEKVGKFILFFKRITFTKITCNHFTIYSDVYMFYLKLIDC